MENETDPGVLIWYLGHSGFAVFTGRRLLLFDYVAQAGGPPGAAGAGKTDAFAAAGLDTGVIAAPEKLAGLETDLFVSHRHGDHLDRSVFGWAAALPRARYLLSADIRAREAPAGRTFRLEPGGTFRGGGLHVEALDSTDTGAAFVVEADGLRVYHAGDLNWWHWDGDSERGRRAMERKYKEQIGLLRGRELDLAFVPVDPRLDAAYAWGLDYLMRTARVKAVFPMHFWEDTSVFGRLEREPCTEPYRARIARFARRGQRFAWENGAVRAL